MVSFLPVPWGDLTTTKRIPSPIFIDPPLWHLNSIFGTLSLVTLITARYNHPTKRKLSDLVLLWGKEERLSEQLAMIRHTSSSMASPIPSAPQLDLEEHD
jgi:hypothetical protein